MFTGRQQWQNEAIPVSRHYREFAEKRNFSETYCLFIAPALHPDTVEICSILKTENVLKIKEPKLYHSQFLSL